MSILKGCNCSSNCCNCPVPLCITKGVNSRIEFTVTDTKGCEVEPENITGVNMVITCPCCEHEIVNLANFEVGRCVVWLVLTVGGTNTLPVGEYNYKLTATVGTETLLVKCGKVSIKD